MESMSPACTLLKIRYDACFNSWFEGYLQPALDASRAARSHVPLNDTPAIPVLSKPVPTAAPRLVTSWAAAFRPRDSRTVANRTAHHPLIQTLNPGNRIWQPIEEAATDVTGKTRAQIKAEEYDRACGEPWQRYQLCLTKAVAQNSSLSMLLEQARTEHPLQSQAGLEGGPWDSHSTLRTD